MIRAAILPAAPHSTIVGEEYGGGGTGDLVWYVDPIDGTSNFAGGLPLYCVSIGIAWHGAVLGGVIYDPERDEMFVGSAAGLTLNGLPARSRGHGSDAEAICLTYLPHEGTNDVTGLGYLGGLLGSFRAVRRLGTSALAIAYVAVGRADLCSEFVTKPWDHAASAALVLAGRHALHRLWRGLHFRQFRCSYLMPPPPSFRLTARRIGRSFTSCWQPRDYPPRMPKRSRRYAVRWGGIPFLAVCTGKYLPDAFVDITNVGIIAALSANAVMQALSNSAGVLSPGDTRR